jgi:pimeloyl-ACP methyl ester carboxylesterase
LSALPRAGVAAKVLFTLLAATAGCAWLRSPASPMPAQAFTDLGPARARGVVVLLPGFGDRPADFDGNGFVRVLRQLAPEHDVVAADAHFGYYRKGSIVAELHDHVVAPLIARGYREVWLSGVSMGGHGAIAYARSHPERITGLLLLAPYMGPKEVVAAVEGAGGLCTWHAPSEFAQDAPGFAAANFAWLQTVACRPGARISLWLGVGESDHLLAADRLLGDVLQADHFVRLQGGHGWEVWVPALAKLLSRSFAPAPHLSP